MIRGLVQWVEAATPGRRRFGVPPGGPLSVEMFEQACAAAATTRVLEVWGARVEFESLESGVLVGDHLPEGNAIDSEINGWLSYYAPTDVGPFRLVRPVRPNNLQLTAQPGEIDFDFGQTYTVSFQSNRKGIRLTGGSASNFQQRESRPTCVGAIQLTPSGELIVIGPDGPTIGGYPVVGVLSETDFGRLACSSPGQAVSFLSSFSV